MKPVAYKGTNADIERLAASLRETVIEHVAEESLRGRRLLDEVVKMAGGTIELTDDPSIQEIDGGSLIIHGEDDFAIFLSPFTTPLRDNFTIAHEVGHYFLHYFLQKPHPKTPISFTRYGTGLIEWQANRFAAALLMPAALFGEKHKQFDGDRFRLSGHFEVSRAALEARAESLSCPLD